MMLFHRRASWAWVLAADIIQSDHPVVHTRIAVGTTPEVARKRERASSAYCFQSTPVFLEVGPLSAIAHPPNLSHQRSNSTLAGPVEAIILLPTKETCHARLEAHDGDHHRRRHRRDVGRAPLAPGGLLRHRHRKDGSRRRPIRRRPAP